MTDYVASFERALNQPGKTYEEPEQVLTDPRLDHEGRRAILRRWEREARSSVGGRGVDAGRTLIRRIRAALARLESNAPPTTGEPRQS